MGSPKKPNKGSKGTQWGGYPHGIPCAPRQGFPRGSSRTPPTTIPQALLRGYRGNSAGGYPWGYPMGYPGGTQDTWRNPQPGIQWEATREPQEISPVKDYGNIRRAKNDQSVSSGMPWGVSQTIWVEDPARETLGGFTRGILWIHT
jgi:hypothetical protein